MDRKINKFFLLISGILIVLAIQSCRKDPVLPADKELELQAAVAVYDLMQEWYLWNDSIPIVNKADYKTPEEMMHALRFEPKDRWSYVSSMEEYLSYFEQGTYRGHGFSYIIDNDGNYRILFVYKDSDLYTEGVRRGWRIIKINGQTIPSQADLSDYMTDNTDIFVFIKPDGNEATVSSTKKEIKINSVLYADTLMVDGEVIGHIVFNSFIEPAIEELDTAFRLFSKLCVKKIILDMRYNRGGRMDVAVKLASLLAGNENTGNTFVSYGYNDNKKDLDSDVLFESEDYTLDLSELIVFTSGSTASASEAIINGLYPYMDIKTIGSPTYGKPVGMNIWGFADRWVFVPITFRLKNSRGEGDYFAGLPVDSYIEDGLLWEFSDRRETYLKEAIYYINTGNLTGISSGRKKSYIHSAKKEFGLKWMIGAE